MRVETPHEVVQPYCCLGVAALELDVEGLGEVLAQLVRGAHLEGLAVAHEGLDREGVQGPGEALGLGLDAALTGSASTFSMKSA